MRRYTLYDRGLMHMYRYRHIPQGIEFGAPKEITQDGFSEALGISRSHAAIIANDLEARGYLISGKARVVGGSQRVPRKIYTMTKSGLAECEKLIEASDSDGEVKESILAPNNINYCCSTVFWSLPKEERTLIGCLMVLRQQVRRSDLGDDVPSVVPFDYKGRITIKSETKRWYLQRADVETLREWHSAAADWCTDHGWSCREKLYHLYRSNRHREAAKLIHSQKYALMDSPDKESRDLVKLIGDEFDDDGLRIVSSRMSLWMGETETAMMILSSIDDPDATSAEALRSEIQLAEGHNAMALGTALDAYIGDMDTAAALGKCMNANGRYAEALTFIGRCKDEMRRTGCVFRMSEVLSEQSDALRGIGNIEEADRIRSIADTWAQYGARPRHRTVGLDLRLSMSEM